MHLRYDLKNKLDLSNFERQALVFLNKEECIFSFYLTDFAVLFSVNKNIDAESEFKVKVSLSEIDKTHKSSDSVYININPLTDFRFNNLEIIHELYTNPASPSTCIKTSKQDVIEFINFTVRLLHKINKLSAII
jgi:hypothetical protein